MNNFFSNMKTVRKEKHKRTIILKLLVPVILIAIFLFSGGVLAQPDGKALFKQNCAACHTVDNSKLVGPGLKGISERRKEDWLIKWIKNSQDLVKSGDATANEVFNKFNKSVMPPMNLKDDEVKAVLAYIKTPEGTEAKAGESKETAATNKPVEEKSYTVEILIGVSLLLLCLWLYLYLAKLNRMLKEKGHRGLEMFEQKREGVMLAWMAKNRKWVALVALVIVACLGRLGWNTLMNIGVTQGYQPIQPIQYSHKIHAGKNAIACQYCHSSAYKGKTAGIPSANICMNCHKFIKEGSVTGKTEIAKIYKALDYNPETGEYGPNPKPIEWIRIHNLPDLAYFNHSQHVSVGKVECQKCHGPIQEMDTVKQFAPLTMGWCVDCHRQTEVKMESNNYYTSLHAALKEKYKGQAITVEKIGGLDCAKCHY